VYSKVADKPSMSILLVEAPALIDTGLASLFDEFNLSKLNSSIKTEE